MKYCPVCHIEYSDTAQFCKKCEAHLLEKQTSKNVKTDYRQLIKTCLFTGAFILFIMLIYSLLSLFAR